MGPQIQSRYGRAALMAATGLIFSAVALGQTSQSYALRVNGEPVVAVRPPERVAGEWFVPLTPIARALGARLQLDTRAHSVSVVRVDGTAASYDGATGRILQGAVAAGQVNNFRQVDLSVGEELLLFPLSGVIALLDVTVTEDPEHLTMDITSEASARGGRPGGPAIQMSSVDERYVLATNGLVTQQSLSVRAEALMENVRVLESMELGLFNGGRSMSLHRGSVRLEASRGKVLTVGDQGTYSGLDALANTIRGLGYQWSFRGNTILTYGGKGAASISSALGSLGMANYDTMMGGIGLRRSRKASEFTVEGNAFNGPRRAGMTTGAGYRGSYARNEFKVQGLTGYFSGYTLRPKLTPVATEEMNSALGSTTANPATNIIPLFQENEFVRGWGYGFTLLDSFTPFRSNRFLLSGSWERYSRNFLVVREESRFTAASRKALSANLRPIRYFSVSGGIRQASSLPASVDTQRGFSYGANASAPWKVPVQVGYFRSVQTYSGPAGLRFAMSQYSLQMPHWKRYSASVTYSNLNFSGRVTQAITESASVAFKRYGRFGYHDQIQMNYSHVAGVDWSKEFGHKGTYFQAGLERQTALGGGTMLAPVVSGRLPLFRGQSLTVSYVRFNNTQFLRLELGGQLMRKREILTTGAQQVMLVPTSLDGQVYLDADMDRQFRTATDRPISQIRVWLDDEVATTTDPQGYYHFDGVSPGTHRLRAVTTTLPAHLVLAAEEFQIAVMPYRVNRQDFRAIRTGKLQGLVSIEVMDEHGRSHDQPFPDARILLSGNNDTFSEGDGVFSMSDLAPGTYLLRLDLSTVPRGFAAQPEVRSVEVKSGETAGDIRFRLVRPVIMKTAPNKVS